MYHLILCYLSYPFYFNLLSCSFYYSVPPTSMEAIYSFSTILLSQKWQWSIKLIFLLFYLTFGTLLHYLHLSPLPKQNTELQPQWIYWTFPEQLTQPLSKPLCLTAPSELECHPSSPHTSVPIWIIPAHLSAPCFFLRQFFLTPQ